MTARADSEPEETDRELYPNSVYKEYAPPDWVVYEVKHDKHVIFEHKRSETLVHAEADGMTPLVSLFVDGQQELKRGEATWVDALVLAQDVMSTYSLGAPAPDTEVVVPQAALVEIVDDAFKDITEGHYVGDHRETIAAALSTLYGALGNEQAAEQAQKIKDDSGQLERP